MFSCEKGYKIRAKSVEREGGIFSLLPLPLLKLIAVTGGRRKFKKRNWEAICRKKINFERHFPGKKLILRGTLQGKKFERHSPGKNKLWEALSRKKMRGTLQEQNKFWEVLSRKKIFERLSPGKNKLWEALSRKKKFERHSPGKKDLRGTL